MYRTQLAAVSSGTGDYVAPLLFEIWLQLVANYYILHLRANQALGQILDIF